MNIKHKFKAVFTGVALAICVTAPLHADDIEIYTGGGLGATTIQPNVMFIIDTSGSMTSNVPNPVAPYDSTQTYSGSFDSNQIYFSKYSDWRKVSSYIAYSFNKTANTCDNSVKTYVNGVITDATTGPLQKYGYYSDKIAQFTGSKWRSIKRNRRSYERAYLVECAADAGLHGKTTGSANKWIINNSTGWTNSNQNPSVFGNKVSELYLYDGNYLNYKHNPSSGPTQTRLDVVKAGVKAIVDTNNNINICLMRYDRYAEGGPVVFPCTDVKTGRAAFEAAIDDPSFYASGSTPLAETYYEALRYFGGKKVDYGATSTPPSVASSEEGSTGNYQTPITAPCQENDIVYLTDGAPTNDYLSQSRLASLASTVPLGKCDVGGPFWNSNLHPDPLDTAATDDNCLDDLAGWAHNYDVATRDSSYASHVGKQTINTYTIGFGADVGGDADAVTLLKATATAGGGKFYEADSQQTLQDKFNDILGSVLAVNSTFSSPAVSVNAFNRSTNLDDLYFTLFLPAPGPHWDGNLKKFKLAFNSTTGDPYIADQNGNDAVDPNTGFFAATSTSYWTQGADAPDGDATGKGGAASRLTLPSPDGTPPRNVYTFTGTYSNNNGVMKPSNTASSTGDLASASNVNLLSPNNANITDTMLGGVALNPDVTYPHAGSNVTVSYTKALLMWAEGYDILDTNQNSEAIEARRIMGDPLHSQPALVQYGMTGTAPNQQPDLVAYVATNDGYLHAFDSLTGQEDFSFVPQELLPNLDILFQDDPGTTKTYGLDGDVVSWINDVNEDGTIKASDGDFVYLYVGQRRGGRNIYSMDVTDRTDPKLRWMIEGGVGDFAELGETWSAPDVAKIKLGGVERTVLIFGAGYDIAQDSDTVRTPDTVGRGIYIVDAKTGQMLWRAGPDSGASTQMPNMKYSIPGRIKALDMDSDGNVDRLYAGDMGGQIWRFDIKTSDTGGSTDLSTLITGGRIADLDVDNDATADRRFYYPPDVALIAEPGKAPYLSVVAVSGYRAHPLNTTIHDRAYMIRDNDVYNKPANADYASKMVTESDLYDTTANLIGGDGTTAQQTAAVADLNTAKGWYISLNQSDGSYIGEKGLSEPLILNGAAIFTTYIPSDVAPATDACTATTSAGTGSVFYVNVTDGTPTKVTSGTVGMRKDRQTYLKHGGIPPSPTVIVTDTGVATLCVGAQCSNANLPNTVQKSYWYEQ